MTRRHLKYLGFVDWIEPSGWWARLTMDGAEVTAQFDHDRFPLPPHAQPGSYLTLHRTRRGDYYFHWVVPRPYTKRQLKRSRQRGRALALARSLDGLIS